MRDEDKSREALISELSELRALYAAAQTQLADRQEALRERLRDVGRQMRSLDCLYALGGIADQRLELEESLQRAVELIPSAYPCPEKVAARILHDSREYATANAGQADRVQAVEMRVEGRIIGRVEVASLETAEGNGQPSPAEEDRRFLDLFAERLARFIERRRAEDALRESRQRYRMLSSLTSDYCYALAVAEDGTMRVDWVAGALKEVTGYTEEEIRNVGAWQEHIHPQDVGRFREALENLVHNRPATLEYRLVTAGGQQRWMRDRARPVWDPGKGRIVTILGAVRDITERKNAEKALRQSEQLFRMVMDATSDGYFDHNLVTDEVFYGRRCEEMLGYEPGEIQPHVDAWRSLLHPEDVPRVEKEVQDLLAGRKDRFSCEYRFRNRTEEWQWLLSRAKVVEWDENGKPTRLVGSHQDVTDRKRSEVALRQSEQRYRQLMDAIPDSIYVLDREWRHLVVNEAAEWFTGLRKDELLGEKLTDLFPGVEATPFFDLFQRVMATREPDAVSTAFTFPDGRTGWYDVTAYPVREGILCVSRDNTEVKQIERELVRLERLRALGEMSAGVSHNLNNILVGVLGPARMLQRSLRDPEALKDVEEILSAATRAKDLVHRLHLATRGGEEEPAYPVDVNAVIREAVTLARPRWRDEPDARGIGVEVVQELGDVPPVLASESGLLDVLVNLLVNAADAMPEGGTIRIRTEVVGSQVRIMVSDTGTGMDEETCRRVFEPFFTTKADVGSGLGLSNAYASVTRWGGTIEVDSEPGKGTSFGIILTRCEKRPALDADGTDRPQDARRAHLLIAEDDEAVRRFLIRVLSEHHDVEAAPTGREALQRFMPGEYDVVLLDLGMPGMPGHTVLEKMREVDPDLVSVLITGWEMDDDDPRASLFDFRMQKPFDDLGAVTGTVTEAVRLRDTRVPRGG